MQNNTQSDTTDNQTNTSSGEDNITAKDKLVAAICNDPDLPALGSSISRVVQLSSSDDESIRQLAYLVLSDVSLTQKILRLSNSVTFRAASGQVVTSISRAIFLLGFNTVKTCALAMILVEAMSGKQAECVHIELTKALAASMVGCELAKRSYFKDAEEIAIAALFKNIGRLLIASHDHSLYQKMMALIESGTHTEAEASLEVLDFNLDSFTDTILQEWNIPASIIRSIKSPPAGVLRPPKTRQEWMQQAAELSEASVPLILQQTNPDEFSKDVPLLKRFGKALDLDRKKFDKLIIDATEETCTLSNNAHLTSPLLDDKKEIKSDDESHAADTQAEEDVLSGLFLSDVEEEKPQAPEYHPSGKPFNAQEQLLVGVQEITELMATRDYKINNLFLLVLEVLYNSLGFRFVTICLKDIKTNQYRSRYSLGEKNEEIQRNFIFPTKSSTDIFSLSIKRDVDLMISDASTKKVRDMIPHWHRSLLTDARSFIVLPLVVNEKPIGLFYADRKQVAPEGITADEMKIIKTLKRQVMSALSAR